MRAAMPDQTWRETILSETIVESPILTKRKRMMSVGVVHMAQSAEGSKAHPLGDLTARCSTLEKENSSLQLRSQTLQQSANQLQAKLNSSTQQNRELIKQNCELKKALCESKIADAERARFLIWLQQDNKALKQEVESLKGKLHDNLKKVKQIYDENKEYCQSNDFWPLQLTNTSEHRVDPSRDHLITFSKNDQHGITSAPQKQKDVAIHAGDSVRKCILNLQNQLSNKQRQDKLSETFDEVIEKYRSESPALRTSDETGKQEKLLAATRVHVRTQLRLMLMANPTLNMKELRHLAEKQPVLKDQIHVLNDRQLYALVTQFKKKWNNESINKTISALPEIADGMHVVAAKSTDKIAEAYRPIRYNFAPVDTNCRQIASSTTEPECRSDQMFRVTNYSNNRFHLSLE